MKKCLALASLIAFLGGCDAAPTVRENPGSIESRIESAGLVVDSPGQVVAVSGTSPEAPNAPSHDKAVQPDLLAVRSEIKSMAEDISRVRAGTGCGKRIALVGDSLTEGRNNYIRRLRALCGAEVVIANSDEYDYTGQGIDGNDYFAANSRRTDKMMEYFPKVLEWRPDTVVVLGGINNIFEHGRDVRPLIDDLRSMYEMANSKGVASVAVTLLPFMDGKSRRMRFPGMIKAGGRSYATADVIPMNIRDINRWLRSEENPAAVKVNAYPFFEDPAEPGAAYPQFYTEKLIHLSPSMPRKGVYGGADLLAELIYIELVNHYSKR